MVSKGTILFAIFTVSSIILGIGLALLFLYFDPIAILIITIIALAGVLIPLVLKGKCLLGSCEEEDETED